MLLECDNCHDKFEREGKQRKKHAFCSQECNQRYRKARATVVKTCVICSAEFSVNRSSQNNIVTCPLPECRAKYRSSRRKGITKGRMATCHPDRPHEAKGLCKSCFATDYARKNRERTNATKYKWRQAHPEKVTAIRHKYLYGAEPGHFDKLRAEQEGLCAICLTNPATDLDHNHATGTARGLLCGNCNRALGLFQENPTILQRAAQYIDRWEASHVAA